MATRAEELFEQIISDPSAWIARAVAEQYTESDIIDFKGHRNNDDSRKNWGKALSGFANTGGGIVFWGVDARKIRINDRLLDVVTGPVPLPDPLGFTQYLREQSRTITSDPVQGVRVEPVTLQDGTGYVLCLIPDGSHKPYRDEAARRYWQRIQDGFTDVSHSMLRAMFYPVAQAQLKIKVEWIGPKQFKLGLVNTGNRSAREAFALVLFETSELCPTEAATIRNHSLNRSMIRMPDSESQLWTIHPDAPYNVGEFQILEDGPFGVKLVERTHFTIIVSFILADQPPQIHGISLPADFERTTETCVGSNGFITTSLEGLNIDSSYWVD